MPNHTQKYSTRISKLPVLETEAELQKFLEGSFTDSLKQLIKVTVKIMIKNEMQTFREEMTGLVNSLQFNGCYSRNMTSTFGAVKGVPVPRFRNNPAGFRPDTLSIFDSEQEKFMKLIEQMHLMGISQRKIKKLVKTCFGVTVSANRVGAIHKQLAKAEETQINSQLLNDEYEYLLADGLWTKTKGYGWDSNQAVLLCVLGIKPNGKRQVIGFTVARDESYESWHQLLKSIKRRGLKGKRLKLVIADDSKGLIGAVNQLYPKVPLQLCMLHKMRNVIGKARHKHKTTIAEDLKVVYRQETKKQAIAQAKAFCKKWYLKEKAAVESLRHNVELTFTYLEFPKAKWSKIRTTNILEREFREIRRRIKVFDSSFNSVESKERYANSIINYLNQNYPAIS